MQAFLADCERMTAIELEHHLSKQRLKNTWSFAAKRILEAKRVAEAIERERLDNDRAQRTILAAESQAASAKSANRRATLALILSVIALVVAAIEASPTVLSLLGLIR